MISLKLRNVRPSLVAINTGIPDSAVQCTWPNTSQFWSLSITRLTNFMLYRNVIRRILKLRNCEIFGRAMHVWHFWDSGDNHTPGAIYVEENPILGWCRLNPIIFTACGCFSKVLIMVWESILIGLIGKAIVLKRDSVSMEQDWIMLVTLRSLKSSETYFHPFEGRRLAHLFFLIVCLFRHVRSKTVLLFFWGLETKRENYWLYFSFYMFVSWKFSEDPKWHNFAFAYLYYLGSANQDTILGLRIATI